MNLYRCKESHFLFCCTGILGGTSTGDAEDILEGEEVPSGTHHDINEDDLDFIPKEELSVEEEEGGGAKTKICAPMPVTDLEAGIICGR